MDRAIQHRFAALAALLIILSIAGVAVVPALQRCCADAPLLLLASEPQHPTLFGRLFLMPMPPRLAALAAVAAAAALVVEGVVYAATMKALRDSTGWRSTGILGVVRGTAASFMVGVLYLLGLFATGYFHLGFFNLVWIVGVPAAVAGLIGLDTFERRWGGLFLILPGFVAQIILMMALGIDF